MKIEAVAIVVITVFFSLPVLSSISGNCDDRAKVLDSIVKLGRDSKIQNVAKKCEKINLLLTKISTSECAQTIKLILKEDLSREFGLKASPTFFDCKLKKRLRRNLRKEREG